MLGSHVSGRSTEWEFSIEASWPAIAAAVAVRTSEDMEILLRQVDPGIVPWIAVAAVAGFHGDERCLGRVAGGMFKERTWRRRLVLATDEGRERGDAARLAEPFKDGSALASLIGEVWSSGRVGHDRSRSVLQELGVKEWQRLFKRVGLGARNGTLDSGSIESVGDEFGNQEIDGILEPSGIVPSVSENKPILRRGGGRNGTLLGSWKVNVRLYRGVNFILCLQFSTDIVEELGRLEELAKLRGTLEEKLMALRHHSQERINALRDLILRARDRDGVTSQLRARELDLAVPLLLKLFNLGQAREEFTVVQTVDEDSLRDVFRINFLDHIHDLLLDKVQTLCIPSGCPTDDVVDLDIVIFLAHTTAVHGVGELDEDRVLLHDALDVLATDSDDSLVVLVRNMERDGRWHLLLDEIKPVPSCLVLIPADVNIEVVLVETIKDDLHVTC